MAVLVGSARADERGKITGGSAGDQTTKEVSTQNWYLHKKGWVVIRPKEKTQALKIAEAMKAACANNNIGYNQARRYTLYNAIKNKGFNPAACDTKVETDCSALVRVCCNYAGIKVGDFNTSSERAVLSKTGAFVILTDKKYTTSSDYLEAGDILVTATKGHTVVVLNNGPKAQSKDPEPKAAANIPHYTGYVVADTLNERTGPGTNNGISAVLTKGTKVEIVKEQNGWGQTRDGGWISLAYLKVQCKVTASTLNVRSGPGLDFDKKGILKKGDLVTIVESKNNWGKIEKTSNWISLTYVTKV